MRGDRERSATRATAGPIHRRRGLVALAAVLAAAAFGAACTPLASGPKQCLDEKPTTPDDYQEAFAMRDGLWGGGDASIPLDLGDGRTLWIFADTYLGPVNEDGTANDDTYLRNSLVVQKKRCFYPYVGNTVDEPMSVASPEDPDMWLWPSAAYVDWFNGQIRIFTYRVRPAYHPEPMWAWEIDGMNLVSLALADLSIVSVEPFEPADETHWYGTSVASDGLWTYVYGRDEDDADTKLLLAPANSPATGPFFAWDGTGWSEDLDDAAPIAFGDGDPNAAVAIIPYDGGWLAAAKPNEIFSDHVAAWWAPEPQGPWNELGPVGVVELPDDGGVTYAGRVAQLPGAGLVTLYNVNGPGYSLHVHDYGPRFDAPVGALAQG